ncbi:MAG: ribonuclease Y [Lentisphaerae bacterium RIFOXYA12_FULL_48_11]|nr:MAG: ribonuclease Y [Lentisphaerae bacterium RIFOXYA12_FULL_48_11]
MNEVIIGVVAGAVGIGLGCLIRHIQGRYSAETLEKKADQVLKDAKRDAETTRKESQIQAKAEVIKAREEFERTTESRKKELVALEERITQKEQNLDRKVSMIDKKERTIDQKIAELEQQSAEVKKAKADVDKLAVEERDKLQKIAGMSEEEARKTLLSRVEKEVHNEMGGLIRKMQENARETAEREAQKIVALAIQRFSSSHASEMTTSTVALPSDDMKGRIIGRDGRNIRALEAATGINVLIDDTPEAVVISGFDPVRREIAKQALEHLIADGRIHPARIEEVVAKARENINETVRSAGEEAAYIAGVQGVDPELIRMLGRQKFRTSYSQNVLQHSIEVSHLMGVMAGELDLDVSLAKRIGLFHDIGKSLDHEVEGGHAVIGADLLKRHGEVQVVVNAVAAHHEEVQAESLYAILAAAADAISSSRVGARSETMEIYVKRLEKLEAIANGFEGVEKSYAIQAGREVRVVVVPEKIDDNNAMVMARNISKKIESDLQYPGQIRVTVIRETRAVEYAR